MDLVTLEKSRQKPGLLHSPANFVLRRRIVGCGVHLCNYDVLNTLELLNESSMVNVCTLRLLLEQDIKVGYMNHAYVLITTVYQRYNHPCTGGSGDTSTGKSNEYSTEKAR